MNPAVGRHDNPAPIVLRSTEGEDDPAAPTRWQEKPMTFQPPHRPSGRSVWLGKDIVQTDDWIVRLSPATLQEIDASVSRLRGRNAYDTPVKRDEFPLTTMAEDLSRMRQEIATGRGFFVFRGLDKDRYSDNELGLIFRGFGAHFGHELTQSAFGDRLGDIRDISDILADRSKRRGYQSGGFQTAHTDPSGEVGHHRHAQPENGEVGRRKPDRQRPHCP
jgi:hypothetical protein